jgi:hypothetical protein
MLKSFKVTVFPEKKLKNFQRSGGGAPDQPIDYNDLLNQKRREENLYR